jgi:hypothetical protein
MTAALSATKRTEAEPFYITAWQAPPQLRDEFHGEQGVFLPYFGTVDGDLVKPDTTPTKHWLNVGRFEKILRLKWATPAACTGTM